MLKKLWCSIFGCKIESTVFTGSYGFVYDVLWGVNRQVPVVRKERNHYCPAVGRI